MEAARSYDEYITMEDMVGKLNPLNFEYHETVDVRLFVGDTEKIRKKRQNDERVQKQIDRFNMFGRLRKPDSTPPPPLAQQTGPGELSLGTST